MAEVVPDTIYDSRIEVLESVEASRSAYNHHDKKEAVWARRRKSWVVAPLVAEAALMTALKDKGGDVTGFSLAISIYASLGGLIVSDLRRIKHAEKAYSTAQATAEVYDELGIGRAAWVEQGLKKKDVAQALKIYPSQ